MLKISADIIYPVTSGALKDRVVVLEEEGTIVSIDPTSDHDPASVKRIRGALIPGLVNTHCHLELSHMKGKVDTGTGLIPFISSVVKFRDIKQDEIMDAIVEGDREMEQEGIVAVGDISNKLDTAEIKRSSNIRYYTFVEMFDFLQDSLSKTTFEQYWPVYQGQSDHGKNRKSCVPHAPYTVSPGLFQLINEQNRSKKQTISIHNQETDHENAFFLNKTGDLLLFYKEFGFSLEHFKPSGQSSIHYALSHMDPNHRTLFVHNTRSRREDLIAAQMWSDSVYWATCANANLYIENQLPDYKIFIDLDAKMTIGTDSLTSNWQLSVIEEMKTIQKYNSYVSFEQLLAWATINGAQALGYEKDLGSIEVGKTPGINQLIGPAGTFDETEFQSVAIHKII